MASGQPAAAGGGSPGTPAPASPAPIFRYLDAVSLLAFFAAYAALKLAFGVLICDDAYITLGHARSWVGGLGPVMSAQNPVSATSTPLFTALLALESAVFRTGDYESLAYGTNLLADLAGLFLLHRIASRGLGLSTPYALGAMAAYGLSVNFLAVSAYGMETSVYTALGLAGAWLRLFSPRPFPRLPAVCLLAACIRPEGGLVAAVAVVAGWRLDAGDRNARWRRALACCLGSASGLLLFFLFYRYAYGHWLPHSVVAKRLEIHIGLGEALWSWIANVFYKGPTLGGQSLVTLGNILAIAGAIAGFLRRGPVADSPATGSLRPFPPSLLAWPLAYFLFFMATRSSYILFTWYYLPVLPFLILAIVHGLARLFAGRLKPIAAYAALFAFLVYVPAQTMYQETPRKHRFFKQAREDRYRAAAEILNAQPGKAPVAMIDEVGALAYFSGAKILDTHGLLSPEALPYLGGKEGYWERLAALRREQNPDWILGQREIEMEGRFWPGEEKLYEGYRLAHILRLPPHRFNMEMWTRAAPRDSTRLAIGLWGAEKSN